MKNLNELTKEKLIELVQDLGAENKIFHCEAQFQFALAWKIQKLFGDNSDIQVYLEYVKHIVDEENRKRYTDIVVQDGANRYVAIELKYKTRTGDGVCELLKTHAAQDLGRYDFLWDTCRNEELMRKGADNFGVCVKGFSILLTNDHCYWKNSGKDFIYENFSLQTNRAIPSKQVLEWKQGDRTYEQFVKSVGKARLTNKINLSGKYVCEWLPYPQKVTDSKFQFLIFES